MHIWAIEYSVYIDSLVAVFSLLKPLHKLNNMHMHMDVQKLYHSSNYLSLKYLNIYIFGVNILQPYFNQMWDKC